MVLSLKWKDGNNPKGFLMLSNKIGLIQHFFLAKLFLNLVIFLISSFLSSIALLNLLFNSIISTESRFLVFKLLYIGNSSKIFFLDSTNSKN